MVVTIIVYSFPASVSTRQLSDHNRSIMKDHKILVILFQLHKVPSFLFECRAIPITCTVLYIMLTSPNRKHYAGVSGACTRGSGQ